MGDLAELVAGALAVTIAWGLLRALRDRSATWLTALFGCGFLLVSLILALVLLGENDTPLPLPGAVGLETPAPVLPRIDRGFAVAMATQVDGCTNPVHVRLILAGTSEYWSDYRADYPGYTAPRVYRVAVVLPADVAGVARAGVAAQGAEIEDPASARFGAQPAGPALPHWQAYADARYDRNATVVVLHLRDLPQSLQPILVTFTANWLRPRGLSSCYLELPSLTGTRTATAVAQALHGCRLIDAQYPRTPGACTRGTPTAGGIPFVPGLVTARGLSVITVASGEVNPDESTPVPSTNVNGRYAWSCQPAPAASDSPGGGAYAGMMGTGTTGGAAYSLQAIDDTVNGDCSAVAVVSENASAYSRDLVILLIGAVMGLGLTLVVQAVIDWFGHGAPAETPAPDDPPVTTHSAPTAQPASPTPEVTDES